jgi:hypothetical protein
MIRTIIKVASQDLSLHLPASYVGKQVEVIAFAIDEPVVSSTTRTNKSFTSIKVQAQDFKFDRDELNQR